MMVNDLATVNNNAWHWLIAKKTGNGYYAVIMVPCWVSSIDEWLATTGNVGCNGCYQRYCCLAGGFSDCVSFSGINKWLVDSQAYFSEGCFNQQPAVVVSSSNHSSAHLSPLAGHWDGVAPLPEAVGQPWCGCRELPWHGAPCKDDLKPNTGVSPQKPFSSPTLSWGIAAFPAWIQVWEQRLSLIVSPFWELQLKSI